MIKPNVFLYRRIGKSEKHNPGIPGFSLLSSEPPSPLRPTRHLCKQPLHHSRFLDESDRVRFDCVCAYCESANYQRGRSMTIRIGRLPHFLLWIAAFVVSIYAVSNLMPLLLHVATRGLSFADGLSIIGYLLTIAASMLILARGIYRLDRRGGRIRNKVGWFE